MEASHQKKNTNSKLLGEAYRRMFYSERQKNRLNATGLPNYLMIVSILIMVTYIMELTLSRNTFLEQLFPSEQSLCVDVRKT